MSVNNKTSHGEVGKNSVFPFALRVSVVKNSRFLARQIELLSREEDCESRNDQKRAI